MIKKISFSVILLAFMLFMTTSCEEWLDVNNNVDAPAAVEGYLYLAGIQQAYQGLYWDIRAAGPLTQMMGTFIIYQLGKITTIPQGAMAPASNGEWCTGYRE